MKNSQRIAPFFCLVLPACLVGGCVTPQNWVTNHEPPAGAVSQAHTYWEPRVLTASNFMNGGRQVPGVAGRLFLFGSEVGNPLKGDGTVSVDMYDATAGTPGPDTKPLVHIDFDRPSLKELCRKDTIGWGYTLFIPWETYNPAITRLQLRVRYNPEKGPPIFAPPSTVTLRKE